MDSTYAYIYDDFLTEAKYERLLAALETSLNARGLYGNIGRLALFRQAGDLIEGLVHRGAKTIVVVGNDATLDKALPVLARLDVTIAFVPIVGSSTIGQLLQIPSGVGACDVLSVRYIEPLDLGKIHDQFFLTEVSFTGMSASLEIEGQYRVSPIDGGSMVVRNLGGAFEKKVEEGDARDGLLEAIIRPEANAKESSGWTWRKRRLPETHIPFQRGRIVSDRWVEIRVDEHLLKTKEAQLAILPKKLRFVTGRTRRLMNVEGGLSTTENLGTFRRASGQNKKR